MNATAVLSQLQLRAATLRLWRRCWKLVCKDLWGGCDYDYVKRTAVMHVAEGWHHNSRAKVSDYMEILRMQLTLGAGKGAN